MGRLYDLNGRPVECEETMDNGRISALVRHRRRQLQPLSLVRVRSALRTPPNPSSSSLRLENSVNLHRGRPTVSYAGTQHEASSPRYGGRSVLRSEHASENWSGSPERNTPSPVENERKEEEELMVEVEAALSPSNWLHEDAEDSDSSQITADIKDAVCLRADRADGADYLLDGEEEDNDVRSPVIPSSPLYTGRKSMAASVKMDGDNDAAGGFAPARSAAILPPTRRAGAPQSSRSRKVPSSWKGFQSLRDPELSQDLLEHTTNRTEDRTDRHPGYQQKRIQVSLCPEVLAGSRKGHTTATGGCSLVPGLDWFSGHAAISST
ncbi:hypothetical protein SprV_0200655400 [Sparganum proliferum]